MDILQKTAGICYNYYIMKEDTHMANDNEEPTTYEVMPGNYEGGMAWCVCCKEPFSADKTIFGISPFFPMTPPDHFCKDCAKWLDVRQLDSL